MAALTGLGLALELTNAANAHADQPARLALQVDSACPSQGQLTGELVPLLKGYELTAEPAELIAQVEDLGGAYRLRIGDKERSVSDPGRQCVERARVAAVFFALNLPPRQREPRARSEPVRPVERQPAPAPAATPSSSLRPRRALALRAFVEMDMTPQASFTTVGAGGGVALELGQLSLSLNGGVTTPIHPASANGEPARFELRRLPFAALLGWQTTTGVLGWGGELGLALDLLRFRGESVPNPDEADRVNAGLRAGGVLRVHASRRLAAELMPSFSFFPRTYVIRVEPRTTLAETPEWWLGISLGLKYSVWGE
ncbi:MAG TPA: hypothetical protein VHB79_35985 [Polyangiaceae bacterium]|nr:hypothetical protein [Polyangiaceae bacterium]